MDKFDVKEGDVYAFHTNGGTIFREIFMVGDKYIGYMCNGKKRSCLISTFKRWWNGAELTYRKPD